MKVLKVIGIIVAVVLVLLVAAIAIVFSQFDGERLKVEAASLLKEKKDRTLTFEGPLKLSIWPALGLDVGKVTVSEPHSQQPFASVNSARVSVAAWPLLAKKVVMEEIVLDGVNVNLIKRKDGTLNIADLLGPASDQEKTASGKGAAGPSAPVRIDIAGVAITNAALHWRDEQKGTSTTIAGLDLKSGRLEADSAAQIYRVTKLTLAIKGQQQNANEIGKFELKLDAPKLSLVSQTFSGDPLTLSALVSSAERQINAQLALAGLEGKLQALQSSKLALDVDAKFNETLIKAQLASPVAANLDAQTLSLEKLVGAVNVHQPKSRDLKLPMEGRLRADLARQSADGTLTTAFDESKAVVKFAIAKFSPLALYFDIDLDRLDADRYLPSAQGEASGQRETTKKAEADKIDLAALRALNLTGTAQVGALKAHNLRLSNLRLNIRAADGKVDVAPLTANFYGGTVNGAISVNAKENTVAFQQHLAGIDIAPLLKDLANKDMLEGHGNVAVDLTAHGATTAEMKKTLAGTAQLSLRDGAIKGINLAKTLRELKSQFGARQDQVVAHSSVEKTDFTEMSASFKVAKGVAHNKDLQVKSPFLRLSGEGDIDIADNRLNYLARASIVATASGQGGKDLAFLQNVTVPVRLTGPLENPAWRIEFAGLANEIAKAKVDDLKQKAQERLKEELGSKLKGLLGR